MDNSTGEGERSVHWSSLISLAIDKVRRQKQRPTSDKICSVILKLHPTQRKETVVEQLEVAVVEGRVVMKGVDTYHNNNKTSKTNKQRTMKGKSEEAATDIDLLDIVMAHLSGHPPWPAIVCNSPENRFRKNDKIHVLFFGDTSRAWVPKKKVKPFDPHRVSAQGNPGNGKNRGGLQDGLRVATEASLLPKGQRFRYLVQMADDSSDDSTISSSSIISLTEMEDRIKRESIKNLPQITVEVERNLEAESLVSQLSYQQRIEENAVRTPGGAKVIFPTKVNSNVHNLSGIKTLSKKETIIQRSIKEIAQLDFDRLNKMKNIRQPQPGEITKDLINMHHLRNGSREEGFQDFLKMKLSPVEQDKNDENDKQCSNITTKQASTHASTANVPSSFSAETQSVPLSAPEIRPMTRDRLDMPQIGKKLVGMCVENGHSKEGKNSNFARSRIIEQQSSSGVDSVNKPQDFLTKTILKVKPPPNQVVNIAAQSWKQDTSGRKVRFDQSAKQAPENGAGAMVGGKSAKRKSTESVGGGPKPKHSVVQPDNAEDVSPMQMLGKLRNVGTTVTVTVEEAPSTASATVNQQPTIAAMSQKPNNTTAVAATQRTALSGKSATTIPTREKVGTENTEKPPTKLAASKSTTANGKSGCHCGSNKATPPQDLAMAICRNEGEDAPRRRVELFVTDNQLLALRLLGLYEN